MDEKQEVFSESKKPTVASKIFGGIGLSFVIMMFAVGVQFVVAVVMMIIPAFQYAIEAPGDVAYVTRKLIETIQDKNFMANLTVVMLFFYWIIYGCKKPRHEKQYFREKVLTEKNALMFVITTVGLYFLALLISEVIGFISPATMESYNEMMDMAFGDNIMAMILAAVFLAPISEEFKKFAELFFRSGSDYHTGNFVRNIPYELGSGHLCASGGRRSWFCGGKKQKRSAKHCDAYAVQFHVGCRGGFAKVLSNRMVLCDSRCGVYCGNLADLETHGQDGGACGLNNFILNTKK